MPEQQMIEEIESIFADLVDLGGQSENTKLVPNMLVRNANLGGLTDYVIIADDRDGDNILARKVPNVVYSDNDYVNVIFPKGGEAIAFQQGSESPSTGGLWSLIAGTTDIYYDAGDVGVGTDDLDYTWEGSDISGTFYVETPDSATENSLVISSINDETAQPPTLVLLKADAGPDAVSDGDTVGSIEFDAHDGTDYNTGAVISAVVDGAVAANTVPTKLEFQTSETQSAALVTRLMILSGGNVGINTSTPGRLLEVENTSASPFVSIRGAAASSGGILFGDNASDASGQIRYYHSTDTFYIATAAVNRVYINSAGVGIGINPPTELLHVYKDNADTFANPGVLIEQDGTGDAALGLTRTGVIAYTYRVSGSIFNIRDVTNSRNIFEYDPAGPYTYFRGGPVGFGTATPSSVTEWNMATEDLEFVDAGSAGATEQDWIEVQVGGATGYIRVHAAK